MAKKNNLGEDFGQGFVSLMIARGIVGILFGIFVLVWPGLTLATLSILLALWLIISGVTGTITSLMSRDQDNWILKLLVAVLQIGVGAYLVQRPALTVAALVALVAIVFIVDGVVELVSGFMGKNNDARWMSVFLGLLAIIAGMVIWQYPEGTALAFVWVLGLYAIISGVFIVVAGIEVNKELKA